MEMNFFMKNWNREAHKIERTYTFNTFNDAISFMVESSLFIHEKNHHPVWTNSYNQLNVCLTTHDAGNLVTEKDWEIATYMESLFLNYQKQAK
jgi:4a-hydroxytetrahydrobiopterin dehydratase